jgi:hypothetical protein
MYSSAMSKFSRALIGWMNEKTCLPQASFSFFLLHLTLLLCALHIPCNKAFSYPP